MSVKVDWSFMVQSRIRMPLRIWFEKLGVKSYEDAITALERARLPVAPREEVAKHLPSSPDTNTTTPDSDSPSSSSPVRSRKKVRGKSKKASAPKSAAEAAADAITASAPVKSPAEKAPPKRARKRRKS